MNENLNLRKSLLLSCKLIYVCLIVVFTSCKGSIPTVMKTDRITVDSFKVRMPLFTMNDSAFISKVDSLIILAESEKPRNLWYKDYSPYITVEPYLEDDTLSFVFKYGKDYLLNFDPPNEKALHSFFKGFGISIYKGVLVCFNGDYLLYVNKNSTAKDKSLLNNNDEELEFFAYGTRENEEWLYYQFYPFIRTYYYLDNSEYNFYYKEVFKK